MMATSDPRESGRAAKRGGRHHEPFDERVEIDLDEPVELVVNNVLGNIAVRATDRPDVGIRSGGSGRADRAGRLKVSIDDNRIHVHTGAAWSTDLGLGDLARGLFGRGKPDPLDLGDEDFEGWERGPRAGGARCDVLVEIPTAAIETRTKLRAAAGDVTVEGLTGEVSVGAASGEVSLRRLSGTISAQTASGDIDVAEVDGELRARSISGDVRVGRADLVACAVQTASGDIRLERTRLVAAGPLKIDTVSGDTDLDLGLSPGAGERGAILEFTTVSGDARVSPPLVGAGKRTWRVGPGDEGCVRLAVRSVSGDLAVKLALDVAASPLPPRPPRPPRPPHEATPAVPPVPPVPPAPPVPPVDHASVDLDGTLGDLDRALADAEREELEADREADLAEREADLAELEAESSSRAAASVRQERESVGPAGDAERLAILTALERGEIDIDEALRRLEPLGGDAGDLLPSDRPEDR